jgi:hypothetical protein
MATASYNDLNIAGSWNQLMEITCLELKLERQGLTLSMGLAQYRAPPILALYTRSRLFMATLTGQSYWDLVAQALLVDLIVCKDAWVLWLLWQMGVG